MYVDQGCVTSCPHLCCWPPLGPLLGQLITAGSLYPGLSVLWRFGSSWAWLILCFTGITKVPMCPSVWQCGVGDPAVSSHRQGRQARHHVCLDQFSPVARLCPTICHPMDCSTPGFPVHHQILALAQTHVHQVGDAVQPPHPLLSPSPPAFNLSQHQGLFQ